MCNQILKYVIYEKMTKNVVNKTEETFIQQQKLISTARH